MANLQIHSILFLVWNIFFLTTNADYVGIPAVDQTIKTALNEKVSLVCQYRGSDDDGGAFVGWMKDNKLIDMKIPNQYEIKSEQSQTTLTISFNETDGLVNKWSVQTTKQGQEEPTQCQFNKIELLASPKYVVTNKVAEKIENNEGTIRRVAKEKLVLNCVILPDQLKDIDPTIPTLWQYSDKKENFGIPPYDIKYINQTTMQIDSLNKAHQGYYQCSYKNRSLTVFVRVKDPYAALWPFIAIVTTVLILIVVILFFEKRQKNAKKKAAALANNETGDNVTKPLVITTNKLSDDDTNTKKLAVNLFKNNASSDERKNQYKTLVTNYYSLSTDFYEYGWGQSFHFANRFRGETLAESIQRHESFLALKANIKSGDKVLDVGCGVGGPLRRIANLTGAHVTGITISQYQIQRAKSIGVPANCQFVQGDFMELPFEDNSFDYVYTIEAVCHAPDRAKCFAEIFRVLKPGGVFIGYDWCVTDKYDANNREHVEAKRLIEEGDGLPELESTHKFVSNLQKVGFKVEESRIIPEGDIPWYQPLAGGDSFWSASNFRTSTFGRWLTRNMVWLMEKTRIAAQGSLGTLEILEKAAVGLVRGGETGIFTPYFFFLARKA